MSHTWTRRASGHGDASLIENGYHQVRINNQLLDDVDGPMLLHGLQEMHGRSITLPQLRPHRLDRDRLAERFERFQAAS